MKLNISSRKWKVSLEELVQPTCIYYASPPPESLGNPNFDWVNYMTDTTRRSREATTLRRRKLDRKLERERKKQLASQKWAPDAEQLLRDKYGGK